MHTFSPHLAILPATQRRLWSALGPLSETLFGQTFQPSECLKALVYFEGGDLASLPTNIRTTLVEAARTVGVLLTVPLRSRSLAEQVVSN